MGTPAAQSLALLVLLAGAFMLPQGGLCSRPVVAGSHRPATPASTDGSPLQQHRPWQLQQHSPRQLQQQQQQQQQADQPQPQPQAQPDHRPRKGLVPLSIKDFFIFVLCFCVLTIAAGAGIGGGTLVVLILALLSGFSMLEIVALTNLVMFVSTSTNMLFNIRRKSPVGMGPLIDYDIVLLFGPAIVMGSVTGSLVSYFIPGWIIKILVLLLLLPLAWRAVKRALSMWKTETFLRALSIRRRSQHKLRRNYQAPPPCDEADKADEPDGGGGGASPGAPAAGACQEAPGAGGPPGTCGASDAAAPAKCGDAAPAADGVSRLCQPAAGKLQALCTEAPDSQRLPRAARWRCLRLDHRCCQHTPELEAMMVQRMTHYATAQYPKRNLLALLFMLAVVVLATVCAEFLVPCGTWQWWLVTLSPLPVMCLLWAAVRWQVLWRAGWVEALGPSCPQAGQGNWNARTTVTMPLVCILAGVVASLLGLGGGTVTTPLLLELGVHPATSAAASQAVTLIGAAAASCVYIINHSVPPGWGQAMAVISLAGALHGQLVINYLLAKARRPSLLVFTLAALFSSAAVAGAAVAGMALANVVKHPERLTATNAASLCAA